MMNKKLTTVLMFVGIFMLVASVSLTAFTYFRNEKTDKDATLTVGELKTLMPQSSALAPAQKSDAVMPMLELDGKNYIGIIESPDYQISLPVHEKWDSSFVVESPCRYYGDAYQNNLIIGGSDAQFDFLRIISIGDDIYVTDMSGVRFTYTVRDALITKDVSTDSLLSKKTDLVLFSRNPYAFDYTIVLCNRT